MDYCVAEALGCAAEDPAVARGDAGDALDLHRTGLLVGGELCILLERERR